MVCSYLLHGCDVIRIFKLFIEERGVSQSDCKKLGPYQLAHNKAPHAGHVVEVTFRNHYNAYDMFSNRTCLSSSLFNRKESNVIFQTNLSIFSAESFESDYIDVDLHNNQHTF